MYNEVRGFNNPGLTIIHYFFWNTIGNENHGPEPVGTAAVATALKENPLANTGYGPRIC
jgi:superoxide dismutase